MEKIPQKEFQKFQKIALSQSQQMVVKGGTVNLQKVVDVRGMG